MLKSTVSGSTIALRLKALENLSLSFESSDSLTTDVAKALLAGDEDATSLEYAIEDATPIIAEALESAGLAHPNTEIGAPVEDLMAAYVSEQAEISAKYGTFMALDQKATYDRSITPATSSDHHVVIGADEHGLQVKDLTVECFSIGTIDNMVACSCDFNIRTAKADEFIQWVAPIFNIAPTQSGLRCSAKLVYLQSEVLHQTTGALVDFQRRSIVQALVDPAITSMTGNRLYPVVRSGANGNLDMFVDPAVVAVSNIMANGETVPTAPLVTDKTINLIGISQTDAQLAMGNADQTDQLDIGALVEAIYFGIGYDAAALPGNPWTTAVKIPTSGWASAQFTPSRQGNKAALDLILSGDDIVLTENTVMTDARLLGAEVPEIVGYRLVYSLRASGMLNRESGDFEVSPTKLQLIAAYTDAAEPVELALDDANVVAANAAVLPPAPVTAKCAFVGVDVKANLTNMNHARLGDLLGSQEYVEEHYVPFGPAVTCQRPTTEAGNMESVDTLSMLIKARTHHQVVDLLFTTSEMLDVYQTSGIANLNPGVAGMGRLFVEPTLIKRALDLQAEVMGLRTGERMEDISAALQNAVRDAAIRMYTDSGLEAARNATGLDGVTPTFTISTSKRLANYLMVNGDNRTLGSDFNFKMVTSPSNRMSDEIFITLNDQMHVGTECPSVTTFAVTAYSPEVVSNLTAGAARISSRLGLYPRVKPINISPVMGRITVTKVTEALGSISNTLVP